MIKVDRAVGIDLGTTNSEIALLPPSERDFVIYEDKFGRRTVPSAVAWDSAKEVFLVGRPARSKRGKLPLVESIKRSMGQETTTALGPHRLSPSEVSAKILAELVRLMREHLGSQAAPDVSTVVERAVITVPAYFDAPQVEATRRAGEAAGLQVLGILQEPTAAAVYHAFKHGIRSGHFLIYDLGGGTFDVSILRSLHGEYQVLAIDGDNYLGGDDFDRRYAEHLRKRLCERGYELELDVRKNAEDTERFAKLVHLAQEIKESLSSAEVTSVAKHDLFDDHAGESVSFEADIGRAEYEEVISDLVERTLMLVARALEESEKRANVGLADIDHVILVGGSTRVPLVRRRVTEVLARHTKNAEPLQEDVDTIVALGASIHAAQLGGLELTKDGVSVRISSPLVAAGSEPTELKLTVTEPPGYSGPVSVCEEGDELARAEIDAGEREARLTIPRGGGEDRVLELRLASPAGEVCVPFALYGGEKKPRASALSRASVVFKDIGIEINRGGRRQRKVLLEKGSGLPASATHTFATGDQSGTVVLRLMQGRMPIKTLAVEVPGDLPVGTKVTLDLAVDDAMRIEAKANVAGQELWATVEAPQALSFDRDGAIEELLAEAEEAKRELWGDTKAYFERESEFLSAGIRECMSTDPAKLAALCSNLKQLIDHVAGDPTDPMKPPREHFEAELDGLRRVVYRAPGLLVGMDREAWERRIDELYERATRAYEATDSAAWRRCFNEAQALYETAIQEEFSNRRLDDPSYVLQRHAAMMRRAAHIEETLSGFVLSQTPEVRSLQQRELEKLLGALRSNVGAELGALELGATERASETRRQLDLLASELDRIEAAAERLPTLGLVTDRA